MSRQAETQEKHSDWITSFSQSLDYAGDSDTTALSTQEDVVDNYLVAVAQAKADSISQLQNVLDEQEEDLETADNDLVALQEEIERLNQGSTEMFEQFQETLTEQASPKRNRLGPHLDLGLDSNQTGKQREGSPAFVGGVHSAAEAHRNGSRGCRTEFTGYSQHDSRSSGPTHGI